MVLCCTVHSHTYFLKYDFMSETTPDEDVPVSSSVPEEEDYSARNAMLGQALMATILVGGGALTTMVLVGTDEDSDSDFVAEDGDLEPVGNACIDRLRDDSQALVGRVFSEQYDAEEWKIYSFGLEVDECRYGVQIKFGDGDGVLKGTIATLISVGDTVEVDFVSERNTSAHRRGVRNQILVVSYDDVTWLAADTAQGRF
jgi:hypothetical protein